MITKSNSNMEESNQKTLFLDHEDSKIHKAQLIIYAKGFPSRYISLNKETVSLGSSEDNDIFIQDSYISKHHCVISKKGSDYFITDQESRNGTYLNHILVKENILKNKSTIQIGKALLEFQSTDPFLKKNEFQGIVSKNLLMHQIFQTVEKIAPISTTVIIYGETGTGKELIARAIHEKSSRKNNPFITVNCGAIPKDLIESELFGHVKGAFTGAMTHREGSFFSANGGTLFLDEVGELPLELQPKLLRVLEQKEIKALGSEHCKKVDVRIIAATHRNLQELIQKNLFREDLFYRLHLIPIYLPPLRDRKEDIPLLLKHFSSHYQFTTKALKIMMQHTWPGNIRELKNTLERIKFISNNHLKIITEKEVQQILRFTFSKPFLETLSDMERDMLCELLERNQWNRTLTAKVLSMPKSTLLGKMKRYNIVPPEEFRKKSLKKIIGSNRRVKP